MVKRSSERSTGTVERRASLEAAPLATPPGLEARTFLIGLDEYVEFSYPLRQPVLPPALTRAETEVATLALRGLSNREIAQARGASERSVANQLAAIFRKLGVGSRSELAVRCAAAGESVAGTARNGPAG